MRRGSWPTSWPTPRWRRASPTEMGSRFADSRPYARTLYPVLISPAWLADSVESAFTAAKAINTVLMTLACVPLYLWARRLLSEGWALVAAALLLLLPAFAYTATIMTESAFLPLFLLRALGVRAGARDPDRSPGSSRPWPQRSRPPRPPPGSRLARGAGDGDPPRCGCSGLGGRVAARAIGSRLRSFTAIGVALLAGALPSSPTRSSSVEASVAHSAATGPSSNLEYSLSEGLRWTVFHAAELVFAVGVLPAAAFLLLAGAWLRPSAVRPSAPSSRVTAPRYSGSCRRPASSLPGTRSGSRSGTCSTSSLCCSSRSSPGSRAARRGRRGGPQSRWPFRSRSCPRSRSSGCSMSRCCRTPSR